MKKLAGKICLWSCLVVLLAVSTNGLWFAHVACCHNDCDDQPSRHDPDKCSICITLLIKVGNMDVPAHGFCQQIDHDIYPVFGYTDSFIQTHFTNHLFARPPPMNYIY